MSLHEERLVTGHSRVRACILAVMIAALLVVAAEGAYSHPLSPSLLEIRLTSDGTAEISWTTPALRPMGTEIRPVLPPHCHPHGEPPVVQAERDRIIQRWGVDCSPQGLVGHRLGVEGLGSAKTDALLRLTLSDGRTVRAVLRASDPFITVPPGQSRLDVGRGYLSLGVTHIMTGWDHLMFVFGLLLLVRGVGLLIKTVTAFTIGHSITVSLTVLGYVPVSPRPIDVAIAFSIFLLAVELSRESPKPTLMRRFPWLITGLFGLLHGAGFAAALTQVGMPQNEIPLALLSFNIGIEVGQILFIFVIQAARLFFRRALSALPRWVEWAPVYTIGCLSVYWCLERMVAAGVRW